MDRVSEGLRDGGSGGREGWDGLTDKCADGRTNVWREGAWREGESAERQAASEVRTRRNRHEEVA